MEEQRVPRPRPPKVIRKITPGMQMEGKVKSVTDFGAFVDVGVGRDGLVHVSEISRRSVTKPQEVLKEGETVTVWIKELDRERNRIGLTMIDPGAPGMVDLKPGSMVTGKVTRVVRYGAFIDLGVERDALLHVKEMSDDPAARPENLLKVGQEIEVRITNVDARRKRVDVSMKDESAADEFVMPEEEDGEETPTFMQMAMEEALQRQQKHDRRKRRKKSRDRDREDDVSQEMEEIIRRTIESHQQAS